MSSFRCALCSIPIVCAYVVYVCTGESERGGHELRMRCARGMLARPVYHATLNKLNEQSSNIREIQSECVRAAKKKKRNGHKARLYARITGRNQQSRSCGSQRKPYFFTVETSHPKKIFSTTGALVGEKSFLLQRFTVWTSSPVVFRCCAARNSICRVVLKVQAHSYDESCVGFDRPVWKNTLELRGENANYPLFLWQISFSRNVSGNLQSTAILPRYKGT